MSTKLNSKNLCENTTVPLNDDCLICSENKRDTLLKPCNHIVACNQCSSRCKKCLICKLDIQERVLIEECIVCSEKKASVLVEPCGHIATCDDCSKLIKKCIKCRVEIEKKSKFSECCTGSPSSGTFSSSNNDTNYDDKVYDVKKLKQQLNDIKEQVTLNLPLTFIF